ncbi:MAG: hypothetical protein GF405_05415 [Candidatus Eisenbacteria bacterium]|nr:hypothetical protein [Candidatus Eisenbacteria bacterium]
MTRSATVALAAMAVLLTGAALAAPARAVTICDVQEYDENGFSPLQGQNVTVRGAVTLPPGYIQPMYTSMYIENDGCGVAVFCFDPLPFDLALGDTIQISGEVNEYVSTSTGAGATTQIFCDNPSDITLISSGNPEPEPSYFNLQEAGQEEYEGRLIRTIGVVRETNYDWQMYIWQPWSGAEIQVYQSNNDSTDFSGFDIGDTLDVTGITLQYDRDQPYFDGWELVPRFQRDLRYADAPEPGDPEYWPNATLRAPAKPFVPELGYVMPIEYAAPEESTVTIEVYDLQGRRVRTLTDGEYTGHSDLPGYYKDDFYVTGIQGWDGRDELKRLVPAGTYIVRLEATDRDGDTSVATMPVVVGVKLDG